MAAIYECERCDKPCDVYESLLVRQAMIDRGQGPLPGQEPWECHACVTDEPTIRYLRDDQ